VFSGRDMATLSKASVAAAVDVSRQRLGVDKIDLLQFYWADYGYDRCGRSHRHENTAVLSTAPLLQ
jgi:aryl-alcohol dehydrogenase-like predicted oxidoreductase